MPDYPFSVPASISERFLDTKIITDLLNYIDLNNTNAKIGVCYEAKRYIGGIMLLCYAWNMAALSNLKTEG